MGFRYSITLSSFRGKESLDQTLDRLKTQGYDAVEMFGEPDETNLKELKETFASYSISVCGVTGMWGRQSRHGSKRKILSLAPEIVAHSEKYVRKCIEMCEYLGGHEINICLFADDDPILFDPNHVILSENQKKSLTERAIPLLSPLARFASNHNVELLIEPLNRFSTPYCTTAWDAVSVVKKMNQDNVGILLDTFHMNIEERSFEQAIIDSKHFLRHMHFAENNRAMPGYAHINFESIVKALHKVGYDKYVSFEPQLTDTDYKSATQSGLLFIKRLENSVSSEL